MRRRPTPEAVTEPVDRALLARLAGVVDKATSAFDAYDYTTALETSEKFFWEFCDDYVELVKERAYDDAGGTPTESARATLALALHVQLRLLAPDPPLRDRGGLVVVAGRLRPPSSGGPSGPSSVDAGGDPSVLDAVAAALMGIRGAKSQAKVSMRHGLSAVEFAGPQAVLDAVRLAEADLVRAGRLTAAPTYVVSDGAELSVSATVAQDA